MGKRTKKINNSNRKKINNSPTWKHHEEMENRAGGMTTAAYGGPSWDGDGKAAYVTS